MKDLSKRLTGQGAKPQPLATQINKFLLALLGGLAAAQKAADSYTVLFVLVLLAASGGQARETARVSLPSHVLVHSPTLTLADLLPGSAPKALRAEAGQIALGDAPQPPLTRILYRQQLQFLLQNHAAVLAGLWIPDEIAVERFHRAITKDEVISAIQTALGNQGGKDPLNLKDLRFSTPVYVTGVDPGIRVIRIESDPLRHDTRFRLWTSKEPQNLPFSVTVPSVVKLPVLVARRGLAPGETVTATDFAVEMRPEAKDLSKQSSTPAGLTGLEPRSSLRPGQAVNRDDFHRPILVEPGTLATLTIQGKGFRIKTVVTAFEQGVMGQEIQVRNTETRQVVEAQVVGRDKLLKTE